MTAVPLPTTLTGVTLKKIFKLSHTLPMGMEKLNPVTVIPHSESTIDEEVEFTTSTQYVISGSTLDIFRVKGAVQVRKMLAFPRSENGDPTADSKPIDVLIVDEKLYNFVSNTKHYS